LAAEAASAASLPTSRPRCGDLTFVLDGKMSSGAGVGATLFLGYLWS
jgi:hypothetical protein